MRKLKIVKSIFIILLIISLIFSTFLISFKNTANAVNQNSECTTCSEDELYPIMHFTPEQLAEFANSVKNAPIKIINAPPVTNAPTHFDLLGNLPWDGYYSERNQGYAGNCWVWAGTGVMEGELYRVKGVKDRISIQYFDSNYNGGVANNWAGCGGNLSEFVSFYNNDGTNGGKHIAVPWSNTNANYQDTYNTCAMGTAVPASSISTTPNYPFTNMQEVSITTTGIDKTTAINNIKNVLLQNKPIWFAFFLPRGQDWDTFGNFWFNSSESTITDLSTYFPNGTAWDPINGGGHAVLCVGYDETDPNNPYWIILNSWGTNSNRPHGIFRLSMNMDYEHYFSYGNYINYAFYWQSLEVPYISSPTVKVIQPNGGESLTAGTSYKIKWSYEGISSGYIKIELYKNGVLNRTITTSATITTGEYNWSIPTTQVSGSDYKIRVTYTSNTSVYDESDNYFTIVGPPPPRVWVIQPNGGESLTAGSSYEIQWGYEGISSGYVKIDLYKGGVLNRTITTSATITTGEYNWSIPTTQVSGSDYKIRVTYTSNTTVFDESDDYFTIESPNANWTILVYLDGDNDLEYTAIDDINEMEQATLPDSINVIVQIDRAFGYDTSNGDWTTTRRYKIVHDTNTSIISSQLIQDMGELNMGDPQTLINFANWGIQNYPANNYMLILWDHGSGWKNMNLFQTFKWVCYDNTNNDYITTIELRTALNSIYATTGKKLGIIAFDACLMGMIEIGYEIRNYVDIMVASEETIPGDGFPYDDILISLSSNPTISKESLSSLIVNKYVQSYSGGSQGYADVTLSAVNLDNISILSTKVSELANLLINSFSTFKTQINNARNNALKFADSDYKDLYHFTSLIKSNISDISIQNKSQEVLDSFSSVIISEAHTSYYSNAHGLSIYYPWPANYYNSYGNLLFAQDTLWDELIQIPF